MTKRERKNNIAECMNMEPPLKKIKPDIKNLSNDKPIKKKHAKRKHAKRKTCKMEIDTPIGYIAPTKKQKFEELWFNPYAGPAGEWQVDNGMDCDNSSDARPSYIN